MGTHPIFESDFDCLTEKMIECSSALGELIRKKKRDEISKIVSFLSDRDVLAISQTCSEWRNYCLEENVFHHHEKKVLLEAELIISSDDLDEEYEMLHKKYGKEIDNIEFYMYIKRRVNAAYNKADFFLDNGARLYETHRLVYLPIG